MTATNHVVAGVLIGTALHNPLLAIPVAVVSHYVLDCIPHFDYPSTGKGYFSLKYAIGLATDSAIAAAVLVSLIILQPAHYWLLVVCGVAAASPDLMWLYYHIYKKSQGRENWPRLVKLHSNIQKITTPKLWPTELLWFLVTGSLVISRLYKA